jgi:hypothetical protein
MQGFMALLHGREDLVPFTLDVGTVRVKMCLEPGRPEDTLTNGDFFGNRNADSDGNDAQVCNDVHTPIVIATNPSVTITIEKSEVLRAGEIAQNRALISARDASHIAVMERHGIRSILTFDADFDRWPSLQRIHRI